jgi:putative salt-induced outer membrane protein YdiY
MNRLVERAGRAGVVLLAGIFLAASAVADVLHLQSGDRLTGEIDSIAGGRVVLKTDFAGTIAVKLDTVASIESETVFEIRQDEGEKLKGQFIAEGDTQQFQPTSGEAQSLDLALVASARQNNLSITDLGTDWSNRFEAGISASSGNTDTASQNYLLESILTMGRSDHRILAGYDTQEDDGVKTLEKIQAGYRYRRFFGEKWYGLGNLNYFQDQFKGVDSRWSFGAGGGYQFWDNSMGAFSTDLALNYVIEELDGIDEENPAIRWGLEYNRFFLSKKAEFFYLQNVLFIPENSRGAVFNGVTGVRFSISEVLTANFRIDLTHETDPAPGRKKTDLTYVIGIGLTL